MLDKVNEERIKFKPITYSDRASNAVQTYLFVFFLLIYHSQKPFFSLCVSSKNDGFCNVGMHQLLEHGFKDAIFFLLKV
jgi:hypothetical protein